MTDKPRSFPSVPDWDAAPALCGPHGVYMCAVCAGTVVFPEPIAPPLGDRFYREPPDDEPDPSWHRTRHDDLDTRKAVAVVATGLVCFAVGLLIGAAL